MTQKMLRFASVICVLGFPLVSAGSAATVTSITPNRIPYKQDSSIIVSGKKLGIIKGCVVFPVTGGISASKFSAGSCTATPTVSGDQMIVTIAGSGLPVAGTYNLILTTAPVTDGDDLPTALSKASVVDISNIYTYDPASLGTASGSAGGNAGGSSGGVPPYTDCLGQSNGPNSVGNSSVPASGVLCTSSVLPDDEVSDNFGRHVSVVYSAIQVRVSNKNSQFDFLLRDVVLTLPDGRVVSSRIRRLAQGVAVKGKTYDPRSAVFNTLTAVGGVYGALASFGSAAFATAGNVFQGPFLAAYNQIFPDYTADNVNRFNNAVFDDQNPSIVPKDSIGQPPLFVVVLVPKEPHVGKDASYQSAKNIIVSVEGTFIKQVTLLSLSTTSINFKPQFISPDTVFKPKTFDFTALRKLSEEQSFTISNTGSTPINIQSFNFVPSGKTSTGSSLDFDVDTANSNCGVSGANTAASDGSTAFSVAPNASCKIAVRFHPTTAGQINATLTFNGTNLEGSTTISLSGTGVGIIFQAADTSSAKASHTFACSYSSASACTFDIGSQTPNNPASVNAYYFSESPTDKITASTTVGSSPAVTTPLPSSGPLPAAGASLPSPTVLQITVPASGASPTSISLTDTALFKTSFTVNVAYETIPTQFNSANFAAALDANKQLIKGSSPSLAVSAVPPATGIPTGAVVFTFTNSTGIGAPVTVSATLDATGKATPNLSTLAAGKYTMSASYPGDGKQFQATQLSPALTVVVPAAVTVAIGAKPIGAALGAPVAIPVTISATGAGTCTGAIASTVTVVATAAVVASVSSTLTNGAGNVTFNPAVAGSYAIAVTYTPDAGSLCGPGSLNASVTLP
jgi:hypothetical protein